MDIALMQEWMEHPEKLDEESLFELKAQLAKYPYFQTLQLLYLETLRQLNVTSWQNDLRKIALYVADRQVLFYLVEGREDRKGKNSGVHASLSPQQEGGMEDRTMSLINSFLESAPQEQNLPEAGISYALDYTAYLMQEGSSDDKEEIPQMRGQSLIDGFLNRAEYKAGNGENAKTVTDKEKNECAGKGLQTGETGTKVVSGLMDEGLDDSCFTETLAKIYVKQHRYEKALEIIKKLSLNYPKKNAYFADQIRFLEKLIINDKSK